ncbi:MAG: hypothetical protein AAGA21_21195 [Pseudomonadota bacterium]
MIEAYKDPALAPPEELPDGPEWVEQLTAFSPDDGETLASVVFTLYPHDALPMRVYRRIVLVFDRMVAASSTTADLIGETVTALDTASPMRFRDMAESYRVAALRAIETTPGFVLLQRTAVRELYDDLEVWQTFGYEGASTHLGGYIDRGFDDLDWLPPLPDDMGRASQ